MKWPEKFARFKGPSVYMTGALSKACSGMVAGVIVARLLTPRELGAFQTVMLIFSYTAFLQLGVFSGLNRHFAFLMGRGEEKQAQEMANASFRMAHLVGFLQVLIGLGFSAWLFFGSTDRLVFWGAVAVIPILFLTPYFNHFDVTYRTSQHFQLLGYFLSFESLFMLAGILLVWAFSYAGLFIRELANRIIGFWLRWKYAPVRADGKGTFADIRELIHIGAPIMISGYIFSLLLVADRSVIAYWKGPQAVGIYAMAGLVISVFMIIPTMVGPILNPKAAAVYGQSGQPNSLRKYIGISLLMNGLLALPLVISGYFFMERIIRLLLPAYVEGIPAARVSLLTGVAVCLSGPGVIFGTMRKNSYFIIAAILCTALVWGLGSWCLNRYNNIVYVAWVRAGASLLLSLFVILYALYITRAAPGMAKSLD